MSVVKTLITYIPEVRSPTKKISLGEKLKWTVGILILFFLLGLIPVLGIGQQTSAEANISEILLGASFGRLLTLGIGPIVTASIILQLLMGAGIVKFDLSNDQGKAHYTGVTKLLTFFFIVFESIIFTLVANIQFDQTVTTSMTVLKTIVALQFMIGALLVFYLDEIVKRWGIGSGVSLFIAAGVAKTLFIGLLSPYTTAATLGYPFSGEAPVGALWALLQALTLQNFVDIIGSSVRIVSTVILLLLIVYFQSIRVEIPLSLGRVRGQVFKWPLNFFYTSNIPVIFVAALMINVQWWATIAQSFAAAGGTISGYISWFLGTMGSNGAPASGLVAYISPSVIIGYPFYDTFVANIVPFLGHLTFMVIGSTIFSVFWVESSGMDAKSKTKELMRSGLRIPGFRSDERILERLLNRYIMPLTIMGGIVVGALAALAAGFSALANGTGILLLVMIIYQFYQILSREAMQSSDASFLHSLLQQKK